MSTFGRAYRVTTFGESHCAGVGVIIDGVPPRVHISEEVIQPQLTRRRPGQSAISTQRKEADEVRILSGTERGLSLGTPLAAWVQNKDMRPQDYAFQADEGAFVPRPSHADLTYRMKYGIHSSSGGGRSSARETIGRVIAGGVAEAVFRELYPSVQIVAWVSRVGPFDCELPPERMETITREEVDRHQTRSPAAPELQQQMVDHIQMLRDQGDSCGGCVTCVVRGMPAGLGEPAFDKFEALLAHAMLSIPATKGFEIGSGFEGTRQRGSEHNDAYAQKGDGRLGTLTNRSGGVQGGITNGENVYFRVAFKPPATIAKAQSTCDLSGNPRTLEAKGRHDPCVVNRAVPIVEAMAAITLLDAILLQKMRDPHAAPPDWAAAVAAAGDRKP
eukprot:TRINITY_DN6908_c0_g1_i1.p1 TRINITY_DN6908_c0_g1~~TRINITY_DN6908_c0_g1_i1.p1  ORF type:complete len:388 (+),score=123.00 TRINITY_DN6908_c0_g1_i1:89-1252(+)